MSVCSASKPHKCTKTVSRATVNRQFPTRRIHEREQQCAAGTGDTCEKKNSVGFSLRRPSIIRFDGREAINLRNTYHDWTLPKYYNADCTFSWQCKVRNDIENATVRRSKTMETQSSFPHHQQQRTVATSPKFNQSAHTQNQANSPARTNSPKHFAGAAHQGFRNSWIALSEQRDTAQRSLPVQRLNFTRIDYLTLFNYPSIASSPSHSHHDRRTHPLSIHPNPTWSQKIHLKITH